MSTGLIILLIVIAAVVVVGAAILVARTRGGHGGTSLKRRFGPEYERAVALHDGDTKAAERELTERVERHGDLREQPLDGTERQRYADRWTAVQEHFVESPREAVAEADRLLAELAAVRGYPDGERYEEQLAALSVHHPRHVDGYRQVHRAARLGAGTGESGAQTEELRSALLGARALFDELTSTEPGRHRAPAGAERTAPAAATHSHARSHTPWALHRSRPKES
ncbi:hypothetical protein [Streptomyces capoamus]|uniref:Secreted protein n=1 Tax=Streptomyces capoamus TaxID=68183 RepID=A0A919KEI8_9ACTN|nr:hypothetical protein [Streptomyces capoamus]GGW18524.1 hypothetical protein GCM10010501_46800 [Streptomyces libani subsp. rufus]GHG68033.1 hypothetical protein GCM10018980_61320 [Streptomyces capoamus]